jgi:hypothetical protein
MHFPANLKHLLHFSRFHKNGFIAFWNQILQILIMLDLRFLIIARRPDDVIVGSRNRFSVRKC